MRFVYVICFVLFQILIALRLDSAISASWALVFLPWYLIEICHMSISVQRFVAAIKMGIYVPTDTDSSSTNEQLEENAMHSRPLNSTEKFLAFISTFEALAFRLWLAVFIIIKLDSPSAFSWAVAFIPCYLYGILYAARLVFAFIGLKRAHMDFSTVHQLQERKGRLYAQTAAFIIVAILIYTFIGLLVSRYPHFL